MEEREKKKSNCHIRFLLLIENNDDDWGSERCKNMIDKHYLERVKW
jgi:hypothetical protein